MNNEPTDSEIADEMLAGLNRDERALVAAVSEVLVKGGSKLDDLTDEEKKALRGAKEIVRRRRR
jgi:hypothetical protein